MKQGGNLPPGHDALLFSISGTGSFECPVAHTRLEARHGYLPSHGLFTRDWVNKSLGLGEPRLLFTQSRTFWGGGGKLLRREVDCTDYKMCALKPGMISFGQVTMRYCQVMRDACIFKPCPGGLHPALVVPAAMGILVLGSFPCMLYVVALRCSESRK